MSTDVLPRLRAAAFNWRRADGTKSGTDIVCATCQADPEFAALYANDERCEIDLDTDGDLVRRWDGNRRYVFAEVMCSLCGDVCVSERGEMIEPRNEHERRWMSMQEDADAE